MLAGEMVGVTVGVMDGVLQRGGITIGTDTIRGMPMAIGMAGMMVWAEDGTAGMTVLAEDGMGPGIWKEGFRKILLMVR